MENISIKQVKELLLDADIIKQYAKLYYENNKEHIRIQNAIYSRNFYRRRQPKPAPLKIEKKRIVVSFD